MCGRAGGESELVRETAVCACVCGVCGRRERTLHVRPGLVMLEAKRTEFGLSSISR